MRRFWLAAVILAPLLPGLALAQVDSNPPPSAPFGDDGGPWAAHGDHHDHGGPEQILIEFYAANTTHDGHLTLVQAKAAKFTPVVDNFAAIDVAKRGYVTFYDVEAWHLDDFAQHLEAQADVLRSKDN